jgi:hypothetical protein
LPSTTACTERSCGSRTGRRAGRSSSRTSIPDDLARPGRVSPSPRLAACRPRRFPTRSSGS